MPRKNNPRIQNAFYLFWWNKFPVIWKQIKKRCFSLRQKNNAPSGAMKCTKKEGACSEPRIGLWFSRRLRGLFAAGPLTARNPDFGLSASPGQMWRHALNETAGIVKMSSSFFNSLFQANKLLCEYFLSPLTVNIKITNKGYPFIHVPQDIMVKIFTKLQHACMREFVHYIFFLQRTAALVFADDMAVPVT